VRASEATVTRVTASATAATPSKSPGEDAAKPASMMSTPSRSRLSAISPFSLGRNAMPGDCSPSLKVVSKILILRTRSTPRSGPRVCGRTTSVWRRCVRRRTAAWVRSPP